MNLWLDDYRPAPEGWTHVYNIDAAKAHLLDGQVEYASLDHDLGACGTCMRGLSVDQWMEEHAFESMPNCEHFGTGYDLCLWMAEKGIWPKNKPLVHSANPVGRDRMRGVIERYFVEAESDQEHQGER